MSSAPRTDVARVAHAPRAARPTSIPRAGRPAPTVVEGVAVAVLALLLALVSLVASGPAAWAASPAPTGLAVTGRTSDAVTLSWTSSGSGAWYRVKFSSAKDMSHPSYLVVGEHRAVVEGLDPATRYWFKVRRVTAANAKLSGYSAVVTAQTRAAGAVSAATGLRVGSYNVRCVNCTSGRPYERAWSQRRDEVAAAIRGQDLDVLGLQEASQAWLKGADGKKIDLSQFEDLRNRLGGAWRLTNSHRNNCVRSKSPNSCDPKDQGASQGTKIVYNSDRVVLLRQGSKALPSAKKSNLRYVAWAVFRQRSTGKQFFFADAHLEPGKDHALHVQQATALAAEVERRNVGHLPTLVVGDMNSHKNTEPSNGVYDVLVGKRHYVDPLGNTWHSRDGAGSRARTQTVEKRINTWLSSWNDFQKTAKGNRDRLNGTYLDYILTTRMRVTEWETVADIRADGTFRKPPPSDHNLIRATVLLP